MVSWQHLSSQLFWTRFPCCFCQPPFIPVEKVWHLINLTFCFSWYMYIIKTLNANDKITCCLFCPSNLEEVLSKRWTGNTIFTTYFENFWPSTVHEREITCHDLTFLTLVTLRAQLCLKRICYLAHWIDLFLIYL